MVSSILHLKIFLCYSLMKCSFRNPDGEGYVRSVNVLEPNAWMDKVYDIIIPQLTHAVTVMPSPLHNHDCACKDID